MNNNEETKTIKITTSPSIMKRLERFFALLHYNSMFGHSGLFAIPLDGDGSEKISISNINKSLRYEVDAIAGAGYDVEISYDDCYSGKFIDYKIKSKWYTKSSGTLYKEGEVEKVVPSYDYNYIKNIK